jgi:hypothetical protein
MLNRNDYQKYFDDLGGLKELARLAKKDVRVRLKFFAHVLPKLAGADDAPHVEENPEVLRASMIDALSRVIESQREGDQGYAVVYSGGPDVPVNFGVRHMRSNINDGHGALIPMFSPWCKEITPTQEQPEAMAAILKGK